MWYSRTVLAAIEDAINNLKTKGVSDQVISNLESMTDIALKGKYIGALMQNPLMSWDELQGKFQTNQVQKVSNKELRLLGDMSRMIDRSNLSDEQNANFYRWIERVALPSYRPNQHDPENFTYPKFSEMIEPTYSIERELSHIFDWYTEHVDENPRFNIFSLSLDQALQSSNNWHEELRNQTTSESFTKIKKQNGKIVDPDVEMIFDKPKLESLGLSDDYEGWMIVKLTQKRDFDLEGKIMGHCVGTNNYHSQYEKGYIDILSLRDESNKPHATIEVELPDTIRQIQGKGNSRPKEDYLKMVLAWVNENKYYSGESLEQEYLHFRPGMTEESALEKFNEYFNPYHDEELVDDLGVPYREVTKSEEDFFDDFRLDEFVSDIGVNQSGFHKTYQEIPDDDKFDELIKFLGDLFIKHDVEFLKQYLQKPNTIGANKNYFRNSLYILDAKDKLADNLSAEMFNVAKSQIQKIFNETGVEPSFKPGNQMDIFKSKSPEEIDEIATEQPYSRGLARFQTYGSKEEKEYDGVYDSYPVYFYNSLYEYMRNNMPREFFEMINKLALGFDFSSITPSSSITESDKFELIGYRNPHPKLFEDYNYFPSGTGWKYSYNHKNYKIAGIK